MNKKDNSFFEEHIEKVVLLIVGLLCMWLFITRVLISPNYVKYDDKKFSSGVIDTYISKQAEVLEDKLNLSPKPKPPYKPQVGNFNSLMGYPIANINIDFYSL